MNILCRRDLLSLPCCFEWCVVYAPNLRKAMNRDLKHGTEPFYFNELYYSGKKHKK